MLKRILIGDSVMALVLICANAWAQNDSARITATSLNDHIIMYTSATQYEANEVASVGADGVLLVDAGWAETAPRLKATIDQAGKVRILVSTHSHGDHTSGNRAFRDEAVILAHRNAGDQLTNRYFSLPPTGSPDAPEVLVDDSLTLNFNGEEVRLIHQPVCHSSGDLTVEFVGSKIVCVGDLFFPDHFPFIDVSIGGNVTNYYADIKRMIDTYSADTRFVAGHGKVYTLADLRLYYDELLKQRSAVQQAMASGKSVEAIQHDSVLNPWLAWSGPWVTTDENYWIRTLYQSLSDKTSAQKTSICALLTEALLRSGLAAALEQYRSLKKTQPNAYEFGESELNLFGYQLLWRKMNAEAVGILKLNIEAYPNSSNVYDSYGEALLAVADTTQAITNYKRSLELNPTNTNAEQVLRSLHAR